MCAAQKRDDPDKPQELIDIWAKKSGMHERKKELLQLQCDMEARLEELSKRKIDLSGRIDASVENHAVIKSELRKIEHEEQTLKREINDLEQRINDLIRDIEMLDRRETEKQREIEEIRQRRSVVQTERESLIKKKTETSSTMQTITQRRLELEDSMKKMADEQAGLQKELEDIKTQEEAHKTEMSKVEEELAKIKTELAELDKRETILMQAVEKNKGLPSEFLGMLTSRLKTREEEFPEDFEYIEAEVESDDRKPTRGHRDVEKDLADAEKRMTERVEELKKTLRIIDGLIAALPMPVKKQFCASKCFSEYEKLHKVVFSYDGTPMQKKYLREHTKWVLSEIDKFLGKLPEKDIDRFLNSKDYEQYSRILETYGIQP